jgi:hypothetical protein
MESTEVITTTSVATLEMLHPGGRPRVNRATYDLAPRPPHLNGLKFGFLDNGKSNADVVLERLQERVVAQYAPSHVVRAPRRQAGRDYFRREVGKPDDFLLNLAREVDVVVNAVGD